MVTSEGSFLGLRGSGVLMRLKERMIDHGDMVLVFAK